MTISRRLAAHHEEQAVIATTNYVQGLTTPIAANDWSEAKVRALQEVKRALRASRNLADIGSALSKNAAYCRVFRHMLAPPFSQDQFGLLCPVYSKVAENNARPITPVAAAAIAEVFEKARDRRLTRWLDRRFSPRAVELREVFHAVAPLLAQQMVATLRRNRFSAAQEGAVIDVLNRRGWSRSIVSRVDVLSEIPKGHFAHKIRFATKTQPQEVDIACALGRGRVLAMECKVTNDPTNSIKRINDVLKKARAWQEHYGSFITTAAMLQGVIAYRDVRRLLEADVEVFWSHRLEDFEDWIVRAAKSR